MLLNNYTSQLLRRKDVNLNLRIRLDLLLFLLSCPFDF